jgi:hypothetical protein
MSRWSVTDQIAPPMANAGAIVGTERGLHGGREAPALEDAALQLGRSWRRAGSGTRSCASSTAARGERDAPAPVALELLVDGAPVSGAIGEIELPIRGNRPRTDVWRA